LAQNPYVVIGNHTFNHAILPNYTRDEIKTEFNEANKFFNSIAGITPISVAFPNGNFNDIVLQVAEEEGFRVAFNAIPDRNILPLEKDKIMCISRFIANANRINKYGSFYRLGYTPGSLFSKFKKSLRLSGNR
jgi:peptidoglycan/xylan/chitin deacetylase (PgdA/CDA1 family)